MGRYLYVWEFHVKPEFAGEFEMELTRLDEAAKPPSPKPMTVSSSTRRRSGRLSSWR